MGSLLTLFKRSRGETRAVEAALARIDRRQMTVRLELERSLIRFNSRLSVKRSAVVVAKPPALAPQQPPAGSYIRFKVPDDPKQEIRLEVATAHFNLTNNQPVFLCKLPLGFCSPSQRKADRFDTSRFRNLALELPGHPERFRVLDISQQGCRILTPYPHPRERIPAGKQIGEAALHLGRNVRVQLATVTPRTYDGKAVGCSFALDPNGDNRKLLLHLLRSLETAQHNALRAEAL